MTTTTLPVKINVCVFVALEELSKSYKLEVLSLKEVGEGESNERGGQAEL